MSKFSGALTLTWLPDGRNWRVAAPIVYDTITVPIGFETDGASVPRPLWWILPSWGTYSPAAVLHDYLCTRLEAGTPDSAAPTWSAADAIFYQAMIELGTGATMRWLMWAAVRIYGVLARK